MRKVENKILRALITITLLFLNYHLIFSVITPLIAPSGFLDQFIFLEIMVTFTGLHTLFALGTFVSSRTFQKDQLTLFFLVASLSTPTLYLLLNVSYLSGINISNMFVFVCFIFLIDFLKKDFKGNIVKRYYKILVDPFYLSDEGMPF